MIKYLFSFLLFLTILCIGSTVFAQKNVSVSVPTYSSSESSIPIKKEDIDLYNLELTKIPYSTPSLDSNYILQFSGSNFYIKSYSFYYEGKTLLPCIIVEDKTLFCGSFIIYPLNDKLLSVDKPVDIVDKPVDEVIKIDSNVVNP